MVSFVFDFLQWEVKYLPRHMQGVFFVMMTAVLWATTGAFSLRLEELHLSPILIGTGRVTVASMLAFAFMLLTSVKATDQLSHSWRLSPQEIRILLVNGVLGVSLFHFSYMLTIHQVGMGLAAILMYTKPASALFLARAIIYEPISWLKLSSLALTLSGIALVIDLPGLWQTGSLNVTLGGIGTGLLAGFAGALFATLNKLLMRDHSPFIINFYNLFFGMIGLWLLVFSSWLLDWQAALVVIKQEFWQPLAQAQVWVWLIAMGILTTFLPYSFLLLGLRSIGAGQANIITGIEPVVAMFLGILIFAEQLSGWQWLGSTLVVVAAALMSRPETAAAAHPPVIGSIPARSDKG